MLKAIIVSTLIAITLAGCAVPRSYQTQVIVQATSVPYVPTVVACKVQAATWSNEAMLLSQDFADAMQVATQLIPNTDRAPMQVVILDMYHTKARWDHLEPPNCARAAQLTVSAGMYDIISGLEMFMKDGASSMAADKIGAGQKSMHEAGVLMQKIADGTDVVK